MKQLNILCSAVAAGQVEQVIPLGGFKPRKWWRSKCKKRIKADEQLQEPWDIAPGGYQVGNFPPLFAEWNDHFRDAARRFWLHYD